MSSPILIRYFGIFGVILKICKILESLPWFYFCPSQSARDKQRRRNAPVHFIDIRSWEIHIANTVLSFMGILSAQKVPFFKMISQSVHIQWTWCGKIIRVLCLSTICFSLPQPLRPRVTELQDMLSMHKASLHCSSPFPNPLT